MDGIVSTAENWLKKPFDSDGDAVNWILFLGFVSLVLFGWHRVISKIATE